MSDNRLALVAGGRTGTVGETGAMRIAAVALAAVLAVGVVAPGASAAEPAVSPDWRARMLAYVNALRADAGVPPVRMCVNLRTSAERYARVMARAGTVAHEGLDGATSGERIAAAGYRGYVTAETLAGGQDTVVRVMRAWRASPTHYAAITDPRLRHVGFGHADSDDTRYDEYWVQHFGAGGSCD